jgi:hypothetical protein
MRKTLTTALLCLAMAAALVVSTGSFDAAVNGVYAQVGPGDVVQLPVIGSSYEDRFHARNPHKTPAEIRAQHYNFRKHVLQPIDELHVQETFDSNIRFEITGTGNLAGVTSVVDIPVQTVVISDAQEPGSDRRVLATNIEHIQGSASAHPDFAVFQLIGGNANGLESPGTTVLTRQEDGKTFRVESSFDVHYQVRIQGRAGSKWEGVDDVFDAKSIMVAEGGEVSNGF